MVSLAKQRKSLKFEITNNDKYLKKAKAEFEEGLITKATLALWQTRLNQAQINLLTLDAKIADAQKEIAVETGLHLDKISVFSNKRPIKLTSKKTRTCLIISNQVSAKLMRLMPQKWPRTLKQLFPILHSLCPNQAMNPIK